MQPICSGATIVTAFWVFRFVFVASYTRTGYCWGKWMRLLPFYDTSVVTFAHLCSTVILFVYVPSLLRIYEVRVGDPEVDGAIVRDTRVIRPTPGERLVYC